MWDTNLVLTVVADVLEAVLTQELNITSDTDQITLRKKIADNKILKYFKDKFYMKGSHLVKIISNRQDQ